MKMKFQDDVIESIPTMTVQFADDVVGQWDKTVASRSRAFDLKREVSAMLSDPDGYSMSHLTDEQASQVFTVAYSL